MVTLRAGRAFGVFAVVAVVSACSSFSGEAAPMNDAPDGSAAPAPSTTTASTLVDPRPTVEPVDPVDASTSDASDGSVVIASDGGSDAGQLEANLLSNGDFETDCATHMTVNGAAAPSAVTMSPQHGIRACQICRGTLAGNPWAVWIVSDVALKESTSYRVQGWIRAPSSGYTASPDVAMRFNVVTAPDGSGAKYSVDSTHVTPTADWTQFDFTVTTPAGTVGYLRIDYNSFTAQGSPPDTCFQIDHVVVTEE